MTVRTLLSLFAVPGIIYCRAQLAPSIEWEHTWGGSDGDAAHAMDLSADGAVFLGGYTRSSDGDVDGTPEVSGDAWVVKMAQGAIGWQHMFAGNGSDMIHAIKATVDGGCIVTGYSYSNTGDFTGNHGGSDCWAAKLDATGAVQWVRVLGGSGFEGGNGVGVCSDGGYIVVGYAGSNDGDVSGGHGGSDAWVVKLDPNGGIIWQRMIGGSSGDSGNAIVELDDGGFLLAGNSLSTDGQVSGNHGGMDGWVARLDQDGQVLWQVSIGGTDDDSANGVRACVDGGAVVAGQTLSNDGDFNTGHGYDDAWVARLDHRGGIMWTRTFGGTSTDKAHAVAEVGDGRFVIAGMTRSNDGDVSGHHGDRDMWVVKLDTNGTMLWQKPMGGTDGEEARAMVPSTDGGLIVAGFAMSNDGDVAQSSGYTDMWVVKLGSDPVGIAEAPRTDLLVHPVGDGGILVRMHGFQRNARISLYDMSGRELHHADFSGDRFVLGTGPQARGIYLVRVITEDGHHVGRVLLE